MLYCCCSCWKQRCSTVLLMASTDVQATAVQPLEGLQELLQATAQLLTMKLQLKGRSNEELAVTGPCRYLVSAPCDPDQAH